MEPPKRRLAELRKEPHWSFSSLNTFLNCCSLKWACDHVYHVEKESTDASLPFGVAFHAAASLFALNKQSGKTLSETEVHDAFSEWLKLERSTVTNLRLDEEESFDSLNELGRKMLSILLAGWGSSWRVLAVSRAFKVPVLGASGEPVSELHLIGETDCEILDGDERIIIDWKTSARRWPEDKAGKDLQPTCFLYSKHVSESDGRKWLFRFDVVTKAKTPTLESHYTIRGMDDFNRLAHLVMAVERAVKAEAFYPNQTSFLCSGCSYVCACKEWHRKATKTTLSLMAA